MTQHVCPPLYRYVEFEVSNDALRVAALGLASVADDTIAIVNQVGLYYGTSAVSVGFGHQIEVVLVGQNIFDGQDPWTGLGTVPYTSGGEIMVRRCTLSCRSSCESATCMRFSQS